MMMPTTPFPTPPIADAPVEPVSVVFAPDPPPVLSVVEQAKNDAEKAAAARSVKVKVLPRLRVVHQGKPYVGGQTLSVPGWKAAHWVKHKFVELVPARPKSASPVSQQKGDT
jgi:hypothetical protein